MPFQQARKRMLPDLARGVPCARCGLLVDASMPAEADHLGDPDDHTNLGWSHKHCNRSAAGRKARDLAGKTPAGQPKRRCVICGIAIAPAAEATKVCTNVGCVTALRRSRRARLPDPEPPAQGGRWF